MIRRSWQLERIEENVVVKRLLMISDKDGRKKIDQLQERNRGQKLNQLKNT